MSKMTLKSGVPLKAAFVILVLLLSYGAWVTVWARSGNNLEEVRPGVSSCAHCGMLVSDLKQAVSVLDKDENGNTVTRHFDDVGCFLNFAVKKEAAELSGVAHDFRSGAKIALNEAHFFQSGGATPMGSGWMVTGDASIPGTLSLQRALAKVRQATRHEADAKR